MEKLSHLPAIAPERASSPTQQTCGTQRGSWTTLAMHAADIASCSASFLIAAGVLAFIYEWTVLLRFPVSFGCLAFLAWSQLFGALWSVSSSIRIHPVSEFRLLWSGLTAGFVAWWALASLTESSSFPLALFLFVSWCLCLALVPITRSLVRQKCAAYRWWGRRAVIFGDGPEAFALHSYLQQTPQWGLRSVGVVADDPGSVVEDGIRTEYLGPLGKVPYLAKHLHVETGVVALGDKGAAGVAFEEVWRDFGPYMRLWLLAPEWQGLPTQWVSPCVVSGRLALSIENRLTRFWPQLIKRCADLLLTSVGAVLISPVFLAIALAIKLRSGGPVLYANERIGRNGRRFHAWKFRTMHPDADQSLEYIAESDPAFRDELASINKLKSDPRVTPVGRLLRKSSLDELPQLWNVLVGDMSLVGPRPLLDSDVELYASHYGEYLKVRPGLTGLWQVSGRNDTTYEQRVQFDVEYVRNWSLWFDVYLLARTFKAVITAEGAY